jgi:hypothetical protein
VQVLGALAAHPSQRAAAIALLETRLGVAADDFAAAEVVARELVIDPVVVRGKSMTSFYWGKIALRFVSTCPGILSRAILLSQSDAGNDPWFIEHSEAAPILASCMQASPMAVWNELSPLLADRSKMAATIGIPPGLVDLAPHDLVISWTAEDTLYRVSQLARLVAKTYDDTALAAKLLEEFGSDDRVRSAFAAHFWAGAWSGPASKREASLAEELDKVTQESGFANVRLWARETAEMLRYQASIHSREEAEEGLRWR